MPGSQSIEGIVSGLDITSIVDSIIEAERQPVTVLEQDKTYKTQQAAAYKAILAKFMSLETSANLLKRESQFQRYDISVSDETILTASAASNVAFGTYKVRVEQLAQNHQIASQGFDETTESLFGTGTIKLALGTEGFTTIDITSSNNTLIGIKDAINAADAGVTASIVNDGSSSKAYRLLLTGDSTGAGEDINFEIDLSGGETLDFVNGSFDNPETVSFSNDTTSAVSLGSTASFSGDRNKIYTFTVQNSGTIGSDNITINWNDGTNSGSILVTEADSEVDVLLEGLEYDGLKLAFSSGLLTAGDTFQVGTFAPTLQDATDAKISIGGGGSGSPIIATSKTNVFKDVVPGLTLNVNNTNDPDNANDSITIKSARDTAAVRDFVQNFVDKYNDVMDFIEDQFTYNTDTTESGVLFADYSLQIMQSSLRIATTSTVKGLGQFINSLSAIGIRSDASGRLAIANASALTKAIDEDFDNFVKLFINTGTSSNNAIEFLSAANETASGVSFNVDITQAATQGYYQGAAINDPSVISLVIDSTHNEFQISVDGRHSELIKIADKTYNSGEELAEELQNRLDNDDNIGGRGVKVEWVDNGDTGYLKLTSNTYGDTSRIEMLTTTNTANQYLGLHQGTTVRGRDVEGTINGESATGIGQILEGDEDNETTAGLRLKITFDEESITQDYEGNITVIRGLGSIMEQALNNMTKASDGIIDRRITSINSQVSDLETQIANYEARLERRRTALYEQFTAMETALSEYESMSTYLSQQLESIQSNFNVMFN